MPFLLAHKKIIRKFALQSTFKIINTDGKNQKHLENMN